MDEPNNGIDEELPEINFPVGVNAITFGFLVLAIPLIWIVARAIHWDLYAGNSTYISFFKDFPPRLLAHQVMSLILLPLVVNLAFRIELLLKRVRILRRLFNTAFVFSLVFLFVGSIFPSVVWSADQEAHFTFFGLLLIGLFAIPLALALVFSFLFAAGLTAKGLKTATKSGFAGLKQAIKKDDQSNTPVINQISDSNVSETAAINVPVATPTPIQQPKTNNYCPNCGLKLDHTNNFCSNCGVKTK